MCEDDTPEVAALVGDTTDASGPRAIVRMTHASDGRSCHVVASAFEGYWRHHGWVLVTPSRPPVPQPGQGVPDPGTADPGSGHGQPPADPGKPPAPDTGHAQPPTPEQAQSPAADPWTPPGSVHAGRVT